MYGIGPGVGIQLRRGPHKGRLVMPCNHSAVYPGNPEGFGCHMIYSDDHGETWAYGAQLTPGVGECQVVELIDGRLLIHARNQGPEGLHEKGVAYSLDGGVIWSPLRYDSNLTEPKCMSSLIRYSWPDKGEKSRLLFANPSGTVLGGAGKFVREKLMVRLSYDEGETWPIAKMLDGGPSGYSCLAALPDGDIACLYEGGKERYAEKIVFKRFSLAWLTDGKDD